MIDQVIKSIGDVDFVWRCMNCGNTLEFRELWCVGITQRVGEKKRETHLIDTINLRCSRCGSFEVEETEI
ncbi:MAG: hypothetical protein U9Q22_06410 [Candidatus Altiarchaeota archaeon]|nr:hypothetical protein [Candidatus Altiarchaeota archaeon]